MHCAYTRDMNTATDLTGRTLADKAALRHTNVYVIRTELGLTQKELARHAGVSVQSVMRAEQGLHPHLSGRIASALSELSNVIDIHAIKRGYRACRAHNITEFSHDITRQPDYYEAVMRAYHDAYSDELVGSPTQFFRERLFDHFDLPTSGIKFCVMTGLHSAVLSSIERGKVTWSECKAFHRVLSEVLHLEEFTIRGLGHVHDEFYLSGHHD